MDEIIVKRLHVSGLTPALTSDDISRRLSSFGTVKAVDGFGLLDGIGQPRKFGYITLETTPGKLSRCLNLLSGSTWKGTKLRIGEAKPDFAVRLAAEREAALNEPPKKKRKTFGGREAADMSLVTPDNVANRGGWTVTPLGRILKPARMRPIRPLPPPNEDKKKVKKDKDGKIKKRRKLRDPDERARRRTIDVTRYGSVHLKGMFLEMDMTGIGREEEVERVEDVEMESESSASEEEEVLPNEVEEEVEDIIRDAEKLAVELVENQPSPPPPPLASSAPPTKAPPPPPSAFAPLPDDNTDIAAEKKRTLDLLSSIFADKNDDADWGGSESVGSDIDEAEIAKRHRMVIDAEDDDGDFEVVPMENVVRVSSGRLEEEEEENVDEPEPVAAEPEVSQQPPAPVRKPQQTDKLKDLFAPREEEAGFSLLGHLDLDLELDDEIPFAIDEPERQPTHAITNVPAPAPTTHILPQLDPKRFLFFPHQGSASKAGPKDLFDVAMENKWHWRDLEVEFYRKDTEEGIRKRWEESKVELTKEWKRRWREAGKISRRRKGGDTADS